MGSHIPVFSRMSSTVHRVAIVLIDSRIEGCGHMAIVI